jgi:hypothetical protein
LIIILDLTGNAAISADCQKRLSQCESLLEIGYTKSSDTGPSDTRWTRTAIEKTAQSVTPNPLMDNAVNLTISPNHEVRSVPCCLCL